MKWVSALAIVANTLCVLCSASEFTVGSSEVIPATATNATMSPLNGSSQHIEAMPYYTCQCAQNLDFIGDDLVSIRGGRETCCDECKRRWQCNAFSWTDYQGGTCWLKTRDSNYKFYAGGMGCITTNDPFDKFEQLVDCDFAGNDLGYTVKQTKNNFGKCESFCMAGRECKAVTWTDYEGGTCWFKKALGECVRYPGALSSVMMRT